MANEAASGTRAWGEAPRPQASTDNAEAAGRAGPRSPSRARTPAGLCIDRHRHASKRRGCVCVAPTSTVNPVKQRDSIGSAPSCTTNQARHHRIGLRGVCSRTMWWAAPSITQRNTYNPPMPSGHIWGPPLGKLHLGAGIGLTELGFRTQATLDAAGSKDQVRSRPGRAMPGRLATSQVVFAASSGAGGTDARPTQSDSGQMLRWTYPSPTTRHRQALPPCPPA